MGCRSWNGWQNWIKHVQIWMSQTLCLSNQVMSAKKKIWEGDERVPVTKSGLPLLFEQPAQVGGKESVCMGRLVAVATCNIIVSVPIPPLTHTHNHAYWTWYAYAVTLPLESSKSKALVYAQVSVFSIQLPEYMCVCVCVCGSGRRLVLFSFYRMTQHPSAPTGTLPAC